MISKFYFFIKEVNEIPSKVAFIKENVKNGLKMIYKIDKHYKIFKNWFVFMLLI
jgi:hypothetical protein